jgi:DNA-directed RNA polymerase specialized sigma24 family protein
LVEMSRPCYKVTATREGTWWVLIADIEERRIASQTRRLSEAEAWIRDAISIALDVPEDSFDVEIVPELPEEVREPAERARELRRRYDQTGLELGRETARAVTILRSHGFSVRDTADLVGVTPGRVSQIEHGRRRSSGGPRGDSKGHPAAS